MSVTHAPAQAPLNAAIGRTPLVRLQRFEPRAGVEIYAKLESRNPGGSVKDRAALAIIEAAERSGLLPAGRVLLDATSGNTGIAYAMIGASRGHRVRLCLPANVTPERKRILHAYGADLVFTDPMDGSDGAIIEARRIAAAAPDRHFYADQYSNPANWRAHYDTTAVEIVEQTGGRLTHFVAGLGTSGTFVGTGRRLREIDRSIQLISVEPDSPLHHLEGLKHMATAIVPSIYDRTIAHRHLVVATDVAHEYTRRLAREAGLFVGPSSGAALAACLDAASDVTSGVFVTVFPDGGDRYLSDRFWEDTPAQAGLRVSAAARAVILQDAERSYPDECCGAMFGAPGDVVEAMPLVNVSTGERRRRFLVGADEYRAAERHADQTGRRLVGFYHSHPDHPAEPSAYDLEHAWPNLSYVIVPVAAGRAGFMRSWRLLADRSRFEEELLS